MMINNKFDMEEAKNLAIKFSKKHQTDVILYNGAVRRWHDIEFIQKVTEHKKYNRVLFILVTNGGHAEAAYKIARHLQTTYKNKDKSDKSPSFSIFVTGMCKSAGTILSIGADELIFSPYGELGPLDVQSAREGIIGQSQSGLVVQESLSALENKAIKTYFQLVGEIAELPVVIPFKEAADAAANVVQGLYAPIFGQINPENIGEKARAMRVGEDYGKRLDARSSNLKKRALTTIVESYCDHAFVIDQAESTLLFNNVRSMNEEEAKLMKALGMYAIRQIPKWEDSPKCEFLSFETHNQKDKANGTKFNNSAKVESNSQGTVRETAINPKRTTKKPVNGKNTRVPISA